MIGIQLHKNSATGVAWMEAGPEVIAVRQELKAILDKAEARPDVDSELAIVAVPAWYNDEQRQQVFNEVKNAGVAQVRIVNEPSAIALAYGFSQPSMPDKFLVLSLSDRHGLDISILTVHETRVEILATNGIPDLGRGNDSDAARLFSFIDDAVKQALKYAGLSLQEMDAVVMAGDTSIFRTIQDRMLETWGRVPEAPPSPETAIATGAAIYARLFGSGYSATPSQAPASTKSGCLGVVLLGLLVTAGVALTVVWKS